MKFKGLHAVLRIRDVYSGSRILIFIHPGSWISDPGSENSNKRGGRKKFVVLRFFVAKSCQKYRFGIRDPRSGKKTLPDPGPRVQKNGSRYRIRST
jgi:hypothetical protein